MEVYTDELLFTQDSISFKFTDGRRIDDAVDSILRGEKQPSDFPRLQVVKHGGRLWSLDNRRLWVFKKARIATITVKVVPYNRHRRFTQLMENPELQKRILQREYWPRVRGHCRTEFRIPARISPHPRSPRFPRPIYVNEQPRNGSEDWPRPINTSVGEWGFRSERCTEQQTMEADEEAQKQAAEIHSGFLRRMWKLLFGWFM